MTDAEGDDIADLTTAPIFDDRLYFTEALRLQDGQTDEHVDSLLTAAAKESGIEDPDLFLIPRPAVLDISTALSTMSLQSEHRSSMSVHSGETQSTTFTSLPSRSSRDKSPMSRMPPPLVRASFSLDRNDAIPESPQSPMRHRHSTSGFSNSLSLQSSISAVRGQNARKQKRASALFSMFRKDSSENGLSNVDLPHALYTDVLVSEPSTVPATPTHELNEEDEARFRSALGSETFQKLRVEQKEQIRRVSAFESNQRTALSANHRHTLERLKAALESSKIEKAKQVRHGIEVQIYSSNRIQHVQQLERLDEFQLTMEHDLRNAHAVETQNVATALKYIEAYCSGPNPAHEGVMYTVTDEDRRKLERQRTTQEKLPAKHESAINVLRAKQERDIKLRLQRQQSELEQLETDYEKNKSAQELQYTKDCSQLDMIIRTRRNKLARQWDLRSEIWRREWEKENECKLYGTLPHETWPETTEVDVPIDPSSSLAVYIRATN
ncbi:hypothetical protein SLS60_000318 [Paraconiothyrium brasiliense]|uniref:Uncharacterized protein n=1 Tax=Paraconiothyrium brasiliense TaxID=300254 RepID=A0ABR3S5W5_9PLEO